MIKRVKTTKKPTKRRIKGAVTELETRRREAQLRRRAAKKQAKEARRLLKAAKKVAKRAKEELQSLSKKLKQLMGGVAGKLPGVKPKPRKKPGKKTGRAVVKAKQSVAVQADKPARKRVKRKAAVDTSKPVVVDNAVAIVDDEAA